MRTRQIEQDLEALWNNFWVEPTSVNMQMGVLRKLVRESASTKQHVRDFLKENASVGDGAIVRVSAEKVELCE